MKKGILYGVSTGPGEPELMTVKAVNCIKEVPVIAAPRTKGTNCMALDIVSALCDVSDKEIVYLDFAMKRDEKILEDTHKQQADQIMEVLAAGKDVAMLNIGDASLFGTYCYLRDIIVENGYEAVTIPGVTSFCAVAAELGQSLTTMEKPLTIIPGSYENLSEELDKPGTKVLMKSASALPSVLELFEEKNLVDKASLIANCGLPNQVICKDIRTATGEEGYFVTFLVRE